MSKLAHDSETKPESEHGTLRSYIIGFLLSLLFTAIPYYLVVNKTISGGVLLMTIVGFAILQMAVQVLFFLHLGRGPKPLYNIVFLFSTVGIILIVVGGSLFIMENLHYNMSESEVTKKLAQDESIYQIGGEKTGACKGMYASHKIVITSGKLSATHIDAHLCDKLTFINEDNQTREIGFGTHPNHTGYSGNDDLIVRKGRNQTITLNKSGTYLFHDHLEPEVTGDFTVLSK